MPSGKPGTKSDRSRLRREMLARNYSYAEIADEMMRRWRFRPRQAWRHTMALSQDDVAARMNELAGDPEARFTGKRVSDYEVWPTGGTRPSTRVLRLLAEVFKTEPHQLLDYQDVEKLARADLIDLGIISGQLEVVAQPPNGARQPVVYRTLPATKAHDTSYAPEIRTDLWRAQEQPSGNRRMLGAIVMAAADESSAHAERSEQSSVTPVTLEQLRHEVTRLARITIVSDPLQVFPQVVRVRNRIYQLLDNHQYPSQASDLYLLAGISCGILADLSDIIGYTNAAVAQTRSAWAYAEIIGHDSLRVWCRSMQAWLARKEQRPREVLALARSGQRFASNDLSRIRMLATEGGALAMLGEREGALRAFDEARDLRDNLDVVDELFDEVGGTFSAPVAKQLLSASTASIDLQLYDRAIEEASRSINLYEARPVGEREIQNEAAARTSLARAYLASGQIDGAQVALEAVFRLPPANRADRTARDLMEIGKLLVRPPFLGSQAATELEGRIEGFVLEAYPRSLPGSF